MCIAVIVISRDYTLSMAGFWSYPVNSFHRLMVGASLVSSSSHSRG
jgi:hypothetical protein